MKRNKMKKQSWKKVIYGISLGVSLILPNSGCIDDCLNKPLEHKLISERSNYAPAKGYDLKLYEIQDYDGSCWDRYLKIEDRGRPVGIEAFDVGCKGIMIDLVRGYNGKEIVPPNDSLRTTEILSELEKKLLTK